MNPAVNMGYSIVACASGNECPEERYAGSVQHKEFAPSGCAPADVIGGIEQVPVAHVHVQALQLGHVHQQPQLLVPHRVV